MVGCTTADSCSRPGPQVSARFLLEVRVLDCRIRDIDPPSSSTTFMNQLDETAKRCHYAGYMDRYVTFPPKGPLPLPGTNTDGDPGCDVMDEIINATLIVNPAFNIYRIFDQYPILWDVLGFP